MPDDVISTFVMRGCRDAIANGLTHIELHVKGIEEAVIQNPGLAFDLAKTLIESVCKTILGERSIPFSDTDDLPKLYRLTSQALPMLPVEASGEAEIRKSMVKTLAGLQTVIQGVAEIRNLGGFASHGSGTARSTMEPTQALLVAEASDTIVGFLHRVHRADRMLKTSVRVGYDENQEFNDSVDSIHGLIRIYDIELRPSHVLFQMEPETYRVYLTEYQGTEENDEEKVDPTYRPEETS